MVSYDAIIVQFVTNNYLTLTLAFTLLKSIAKITPWAWDDSIISLFFGVFEKVRPGADTKTKQTAPAAWPASGQPKHES